MNTNNTFSYVTNCGDLKRTIFKINDFYYIGFVEYSYDEAIENIKENYKDNPLLDEYLNKIEQLKNGGESMENFDWDANSWFVVKYCPFLIRQYPEKFNWKKYSFDVVIFCPELIKEFPEKFDWEECTPALIKYHPGMIEDFPERFNDKIGDFPTRFTGLFNNWS